eukprot:TRINITY_DN15512_c0_g1_i1.p1 TRINITY_DN15512_c0_g1~~TRINITY_DN15512_c0_g1_i1.p1  ORF type:complete len:235 (-),score=38.12 TRINITY_DN15512_c0_g1_i1:48-752(-)
MTAPLREEIERLQKEKNVIEEKYKALLEDSSDREKEHANEIKQLRHQVETWQATVKKLEKENHDMQAIMKKLETENHDMQAKLTQLESEMGLLMKIRKKEGDMLLVHELARHTEKLICRHILGEDTNITSLSIAFGELAELPEAKERWEQFKTSQKWDRRTWNETWSLMQELKEFGVSFGHPCTDFEGNPVTVKYLRQITLDVIDPRQEQQMERIISALLRFRPSGNLFQNGKI